MCSVASEPSEREATSFAHETSITVDVEWGTSSTTIDCSVISKKTLEIDFLKTYVDSSCQVSILHKSHISVT